jgi:chromosome partitioning protein
MKTISVISQKGGAGKTTVVINLAGAAEALGWRAVVVDLDPQASAKGWHDHRQHEAPIVISAQASRLGDVLTTAARTGPTYASSTRPRNRKRPPSPQLVPPTSS